MFTSDYSCNGNTQVDRDTAVQAIYQQLAVTINDEDIKRGATGGLVGVLGFSQLPVYLS